MVTSVVTHFYHTSQLRARDSRNALYSCKLDQELVWWSVSHKKMVCPSTIQYVIGINCIAGWDDCYV